MSGDGYSCRWYPAARTTWPPRSPTRRPSTRFLHLVVTFFLLSSFFFCQRRNFFFTEQTEHGTRYRPPTCLVRHTSISFRSLAVARLYSDGAVRYPRYPGHSRTNTRAHGDVHRTRCLEATMPFFFPPFVVSAIPRFR